MRQLPADLEELLRLLVGVPVLVDELLVDDDLGHAVLVLGGRVNSVPVRHGRGGRGGLAGGLGGLLLRLRLNSLQKNFEFRAEMSNCE